MPRSPRPSAPTGITERLRLEPLAESHIPLITDALLDPLVYRWIEPHRDAASFEAFCLAVIAGPGDRFPDQAWWNHALLLRDTGVGIGRLEATFIGNQVEVAYLLGSAWWQRGLGSEALQWLLANIHQAVPEAEIWATVHPDNLPSQQVARRNGFQLTTEFPDTLRSYDPGDLVYRHDRR